MYGNLPLTRLESRRRLIESAFPENINLRICSPLKCLAIARCTSSSRSRAVNTTGRRSLSIDPVACCPTVRPIPRHPALTHAFVPPRSQDLPTHAALAPSLVSHHRQNLPDQPPNPSSTLQTLPVFLTVHPIFPLAKT